MTNMAECVKLARVHGGEWGVSVENPEGGAFSMSEIQRLGEQIFITAHVAAGRNDEEWQARLDAIYGPRLEV